MYEYEDYGEYAYGTGDPLLDREYERQSSAAVTAGSSYIPDPVKNFIIDLRDMIKEGNAYEIGKLFEGTFQKLTDQYYRNSLWPAEEEIRPLVQGDQLFLILYQELYYRHVHSSVSGGPAIEHRLKSYFNYCNLFNYIVSANKPVKLDLPNQWLWLIIDEFIYQFQSFQQYKSKLQAKLNDDKCDDSRVMQEVEVLKEHTRVWDVLQVLNVLHSMVDKSCINKQLEVYTSGGDPNVAAGEFGRVSLYKMMGYFSLVGLLRLHSLLGDFYQAIKVLENIELSKTSLYSRVPGCQITMYYYVGFGYMMMRRYADAIRIFSNILVYIHRTKMAYQTKAYQYGQILKLTEKMFVLLSICLVLYPQRVDETLQSMLKEKKYAERISKMQQGDEAEFESAFAFACPKFLSPVSPSLDKEANKPETSGYVEPLRHQLKVFMDEVEQQPLLLNIRSFLRLYTSMPLEKLAEFMGKTVDDLENNLLCFKHKMMNVVCTKGASGLEGEFQSESEVDFYIDKNMIYIADTKVDTRYGDYFISQIHKYDELNRSIKGIKL